MAGARRADASRRGMSDAVDATGSITEGIMANQQRNGRNVAMPEENRQSWRPQDEGYRDEDRFASRDRERMGAQWDDRSSRWDDREDRSQSTEYYGQGQSGYGAGRYEGDR